MRDRPDRRMLRHQAQSSQLCLDPHKPGRRDPHIWGLQGLRSMAPPDRNKQGPQGHYMQGHLGLSSMDYLDPLGHDNYMDRFP
jgi:hypothetical protein